MAAPESEGWETGITRQMSNLIMSTSIRLFFYTDIEIATNGLSESSRMWSWRYGRYYKGYLDDRTEVYIKMLDPKLPKDEADFVQELKVLKDLRHPNLAELVGACIEHPAVFYKFPTYDNLELCLENRPWLLTWQIRTTIIYQICSTLVFLYSNTNKQRHRPIIHGHLTPANILIDANFNCRVSIPEGTATSNPNPLGRFTEYIETGNRRLGDDVYSLGIMVLRLLTGLSAATTEGQAHGARIIEWSMAKVDQNAGNWPSELAEELAYFGAKCCYSSKSNLLHMEKTMKELGNFLAMMDNFKNKETIQCSDYKYSHVRIQPIPVYAISGSAPEYSTSISSDYKDSKSIRIESGGTTSEDIISHILSRRTSSFKVFSYLDILRATNGLSKSLKIDQGGYGSVYKGYLDNTEVVAIKMLDTAPSKQNSAEFIQELEALGQMRHPNIVKLIGACITHQSLVYEFLPFGSLEFCLQNFPWQLTWQYRTRFVYEICSVLNFLHSNKSQPLLHGDLKPANIFLDDNLNLKLANFGLCRFLPQGTNTKNFYKTNIIQGTEWYIDPDYLETGELSPRCDVYSFGVTILRILTGKSPARIVTRVYNESYDRKSLMKIVDSTAGPWPGYVAEYLASIGLRCCKSEESRSELMMEIMKHLGNLLDVTNNFIDKEVSKSISKETWTSNVKVFLYSDIERATNGFSKLLKFGKGAYGTVYRGYLDNTEVAIKMLDCKSNQGSEEFNQELKVLGQMRHPNLVKLIGACYGHRSLVYEFLPNGSLEDCLEKRSRLLTWQRRIRIIYEICSTLIFLHSNKPKPLLHGDLKPANILLDVNFNIKLADFGLCRFLPEGTNTVKYHKTKTFQGTEWYIDPDYLVSGNLSPGCDVYSFGVTIFRILTGLTPVQLFTKVHAAYEKKN